MNLIFLGAPGVGKGTQAKLLMKKYQIPQISTGDILRDAVRNNTLLGQKAQDYMNKGLLVPDEVVIGIIEERFRESSCQSGFILDGFPRTIPQAESLDRVLDKLDISLDQVINFEVEKEILIKRLSGRRVCKNCGQMYNIYFNAPSREGICDQCEGELFQRKDDSLETIQERLHVYQVQTAPLIEYYQSKKKLSTIAADKDQSTIFNQLCNLLGN